MRLHWAVAVALVLVGGTLLAIPVYEWLHHFAARSTSSDVPSAVISPALLQPQPPSGCR